MWLEVGEGAESDSLTVTLEDPANIYHLSVLVDPRWRDRLGEALDASGWGRIDADGEHVWIPVAHLRADSAAGGATEEELDTLVRYCERHEWLSRDGSEVRAHVEVG